MSTLMMARKKLSGCSCTPAYATGDRTASITVTTSASTTGGAGTPSNWVDGAVGVSDTDGIYWFSSGMAVSGKWVKFQFAASTKITEAKWYQDTTNGQATWKWQGSNDDSAWTDIGSSFVVGGATTQTQTELSGNTTGYLYYRLLGVSGNATGQNYLLEIEFKQCAC